MEILKGIPVSIGYAVGPSFVYRKEEIRIENRKPGSIDHEWQRLGDALARARSQIDALYDMAESETSANEAAIFKAHRLFLEDPELLATVKAILQQSECCAEVAWGQAIEKHAAALEALRDEYLSARASDLRDVGNRVLRMLTGQQACGFSALMEPSIIIAKELLPSDTIQLDKALVLGFCVAEGGPTSHAAILAKALGLPAVVGLGESIMSINSGTLILVDGKLGEITIDPDSERLRIFKLRLSKAKETATLHCAHAREKALTLDGVRVEVAANIGSLEEAGAALEFGADGIGLFRTEFLCLGRNSAPTEEEHLELYSAVLNCMQKRPVVIRTFDIGGDKQLPFIDFGEESNPFLGWRAIRMCLDEPEFFKTQLRALFRASPGHDMRIMFPMIATLRELRMARKLLEDARGEVEAKGQLINDSVQLGMMVEIPSAAILADAFAREVDFFSIGTNDLTQYTLAAERTNAKVAHLGDPCHPAVLKLIHTTIESAHSNGIWVGLCGEMAGDPTAIPILLGLGVDELSMVPSSIPRAKAIIRQWSISKARTLAQEALRLASASDVRTLVENAEPG